MIRAVIFDCFGVLTADTWHEFRTSLRPELQEQASELNHQYCSSNITMQKFLSSVAKLTSISEQDVEEVIDNQDGKNLRLLKYITELKQRGYKIGLISNVANNFIRERLLSPDEQQLFDTFVFSYEEGLIKPEARMYRLAAERLGVSTEECAYIDDISSLSEGARRTGMHAIVYQNFSQMKSELEELLINADN